MDNKKLKMMESWLESKQTESNANESNNNQLNKFTLKPIVKNTNSPKKTLKRKTTETKKIQLNEDKSSIVLKSPAKPKWFPGAQRKPPPKAGQAEIPDGDRDCLKGLKFVITGVLDTLEREDAVELINKFGGRVTTAVSGVTSYLIKGDEPGESKINKAKDKNIPVITEEQLFDIIRKNSPNLKKNKKSLAKQETQETQETKEIEKTKITNSKKSKEKTKKIEKTQSGVPLSEKYRPKVFGDLLGNKGAIEKMKKFVKDFGKNQAAAVQSSGKNSKSWKNAMLISGSPGIGKTSAVYVVAREFGFEVIEMNASDVRSRKILDEKIKETLTNKSVRSMFRDNKSRRVSGKIILMEEIDGMSSGDYGGISELIKMIKQTRFPIICTCNDRQALKLRSIANYCVDVRFVKPAAFQIEQLVLKIANTEKISISPLEIKDIVFQADCDIRNVLNTLEFRKHKQTTTSDPKKRKNKDEMMSAWDASTKLFERNTGPRNRNFFDERIQCYFSDQMLVPLLVQENYLNYEVYENMDVYSKAADLISESDIVGSKIYSGQNFSLMPLHAVLSSVAPSELVSSGKKPFRLNFPSWLGKNSTLTKNKKLCSKAYSKANLTMKGVSSRSFQTECADSLYRFVSTPLMERGKDGVDLAIERMDAYGLDRDDFDFLQELSSFETDVKSIDSKVKTAFTRRYNALKHSKTEPKGTRGGKRKLKKVSDDRNRNEDDYEDDGFIVRDEEEESSDDSFIVPVKKKTKKAKSNKSQTAGAGQKRKRGIEPKGTRGTRGTRGVRGVSTRGKRRAASRAKKAK